MKSFRTLIAIPLALSVFSILQASAVSAAISTDPTSVKAESTPGTATAVVTWTAPSGATRYRIKAYIGTVAVKTSGIVTARTSYTFSGLEYDIPYTLKVEAGDATTWRSAVTATPTITPVAASPSAPAAPRLSATGDLKLEASWAEPDSDGGAAITSYSVQLKKSGGSGSWENVGDPISSNALVLTLTTPDSTSSYAVTVSAKNSAGKSSPASDESNQVTAVAQTSAQLSSSPAPSEGSPNTPSGGNPGSPVAEAPATGNKNTDSAPNSGSSSPGSNSTSATVSSPLVAPISYSAPVVSYSKSVYVSTRTSTKTLLALSKLTTPKGSTTSFTLSSTSRKYCSLKGSVVTAVKSGTCSVTVTVKQKSGKKTSKTVKLVVRAKR